MDTTRASLLIRIRHASDTQAWSTFHDLYAPLLYRFARARGLSHEDAEEVRATCYEAIVRQIPHFEYDKSKGGFKAWLRTLVSRRVIDLLRKRREQIADTDQLLGLANAELSVEELWEKQWRQQHLRFCMQQARIHVSEATYEAFIMLMEEGVSVPDVCERLGMTANQVYKAKARMLETLRELMQSLQPDES
ncbi:MAG: sigma-70 family RNA polymerase sigma factor [Pirellulaceae bacterium]|jgi:RNA polymerase sigma-70 factor (ECF subfamily)|nr:sigma-70 family RNA polymerase sigma factor [Pirellulaceae bacterium]